MDETFDTLPLFGGAAQTPDQPNSYPSLSEANTINREDRAFHDWYRFVLSFPPHLVRHYLREFALDDKDIVFDPFCGTGTTLVEAKRHGYSAIGLEANPFAHFASSVKVDWSVSPTALLESAHDIGCETQEILRSEGIDDTLALGNQGKVRLRKLEPAKEKLLIAHSISPLPLHKTLVLTDCLKKHADLPHYGHLLLALGKALVATVSNLRFGPEVGVGKRKHDVPVVSSWTHEVSRMAEDLRGVQAGTFPHVRVHLADARNVAQVLGIELSMPLLHHHLIRTKRTIQERQDLNQFC
jgi:hypothetical protein